MEFRLCYVDSGVMYFTDDFENVASDDWDDAPYEHNAEPPYPMSDIYSEEENRRFGNTKLRYLAFMKSWETREPCDGHLNSPYCVDDINNGAIPWLYNPKAGGLMAGATIEEAIKWCKKAEIKCGELK